MSGAALFPRRASRDELDWIAARLPSLARKLERAWEDRDQFAWRESIEELHELAERA